MLVGSGDNDKVWTADDRQARMARRSRAGRRRTLFRWIQADPSSCTGEWPRCQVSAGPYAGYVSSRS